MDLQLLVFLFPAGVILCFRELRDEHLFVIIYAVLASYFAGVMVRLMLTLTPVVCVASAIALSTLLEVYLNPTEPDSDETKQAPAVDYEFQNDSNGNPKLVAVPPASSVGKKAGKKAAPLVGETSTPEPSTKKASGAKTKTYGIWGFDTRILVVFNALWMLVFFVVHSTYVTASAYSSPSVVLASTGPDGSQHIIDDFREAYYWLRQNTPKDTVIMSWWDYGYQIAGMADRVTLVDNNTWNNSAFFHSFSCTPHDQPKFLSSPHCYCRKGYGLE